MKQWQLTLDRTGIISPEGDVYSLETVDQPLSDDERLVRLSGPYPRNGQCLLLYGRDVSPIHV